MNEIYIVCEGDVESHKNLAVFCTFRRAEVAAESRARIMSCKRDECFEKPEVALWSRVSRGALNGRMFGYVSIEKWELK